MTASLERIVALGSLDIWIHWPSGDLRRYRSRKKRLIRCISTDSCRTSSDDEERRELSEKVVVNGRKRNLKYVSVFGNTDSRRPSKEMMTTLTT